MGTGSLGASARCRREPHLWQASARGFLPPGVRPADSPTTGVLGIVSPGSHDFYALGSEAPGWKPITVGPDLTLRGLAFVVGLSLLFAIAVREFNDSKWRLRLVFSLALTGAFITLVGLVQQASLDPGNIYGLWRPQHDYAVFGPYVNKNHYAGFMAMAVPLSIGLAVDAFDRFARSWKSRRVGWLAIGDPSGTRFLRIAAMAMLMIVGVLLCESRGGLVALGAGLAAMGLRAGHRRRWLLGGGILLILLASLWVDLGRWTQHFQRSFNDSRWKLWVDQSSLVGDFPLLGVGFNALGPAYRPRQTVNVENAFDQAHNEYLQVLLDTGLVGAAIFLTFFACLLAAAWRAAVVSPVQLGIWGALVGAAASNVFDFNWQIPANAAAFVALAGVSGLGGRSP